MPSSDSLPLFGFISFFFPPRFTVSKEAAAFAKAKKNCTETFGKCRKFEDAVSEVTELCNTKTDELKQDLKKLKDNIDSVTKAKATVDSKTSARNKR